MMRKANVYLNELLAGELVEISGKEYTFRYMDDYFHDATKPAISLTLPKTQQEYHSTYLFPFFFNMLSEGSNRVTQSRLLRIDEQDHFGILLATAQNDVTGAMQGNIVSGKLLDKLSFTSEGILREWMLWNEQYYDMTTYSLLKSNCNR